MGKLKFKNDLRKMFTDDLPRWRITEKLPEGNIDWKNCVGKKVSFIYGDIKGYIEILNYKNGYLDLKYNENVKNNVWTSHFVDCKIAELLNIITKDFKLKKGEIINELEILDIELRDNPNNKNSKLKFYKYKCLNCGYIGEINEYNLINKKGCACCSGKTVAEGINDIATTDPWMVKLGISEHDAKKYTCNSTKKIKIKCPYCQEEKEKSPNSIYSQKSIGCSCGDSFSYGHKYVFNLLKQLNTEFVDNYTPKWCEFNNSYKKKQHKGNYDFMINNIKLIIEVDGSFHRKDNKLSGQKIEESKFLDQEKDRLAHENGYNIVRIMYDDINMEIKNSILNSEMINNFDLSTIDWNKCEGFALSNRVKEACELWNSDNFVTTNDIGLIMNLDEGTIRTYLKKGYNLNWCDYTTILGKLRSNRKVAKNKLSKNN